MGEEGGVPTMHMLGFKEWEEGRESLFPGGESPGLQRLQSWMQQKVRVCNFEKPKTLPCAIEPDTTALSPYLKFGCVSARTFYWDVQGVIAGKAHSKPPTSLIGQLLWRDFYITVAYDTLNFDKMRGNAICRQIPWESDDTVDYQERLAAWKEGRTGYPWIDAAMTQLRQQGWIHHLARHAVACFLTRGDLWVSWEKGAEVFDYYLLDADWALNNGNWMWLSASAFYHQFARVYSPISFQQKNDPEGKYIKHFLPQLKKVPKKFIYSPWTMSKAEQKLYGVIIGKDYPAPIVDHKEAKQYNMDLMAKAYKEAREAKASSASSSSSSSSKRKRAPVKAKGGGKKGKQKTMEAFITKK